jgi:cytoskeletal protein CcmA (bactofilin family)
MSSPPSYQSSGQQKGGGQAHLDEMTCLLYLERQLERTRALEVSAHTQSCDTCRTLLRAMERESRLLTRAMLEEEEPLPARIASFQERVQRSMQWVWMVAFGLSATAVYAMYTGYIEPLQQRLEQAGFGGTSLLSMLIFQGSFWKGWQSMISLVEVLALVTLGGFGVIVARKRLRRGSALALVLTGLCAAFVSAPPATATEFRKGPSIQIASDETVKEDVYATGQEINVDGTVDGDLYVWGQEAILRGHVTGDVFLFVQSARIEGQVDGSVRGFCNNITVSGSVERSLMVWAQVIHVDSRGSIGRTVTSFSQTLGIDGKVGRDLLVFNQTTRINGSIGGNIDEKSEALTIEDSAQVSGTIRYEGNKEPVVSKKAKLASEVQFIRHVKHREEFGKSSVVWALLLAAAFVLFGLVLFLVMSSFSREAVHASESYGASLGLGVLVLFAVPIASLIACVTFVGIFIGLSTFVVWIIALFAAQTVVGAVIGQWILGKTEDTWGRIGRMAIGVLIIRAVTLLPHGGWIKLVVLLWGIGAISLALYRRFQPVAPPAQTPYAPPSAPLTPLTPAGGAPAV